MKSSAKVSLFTFVPSGSIKEELVLSAWLTGLNEFRLVFRLEDRRLLASYFWRKSIVAPVVQLLACPMLARNKASQARDEKIYPGGSKGGH
jgi:hypothetical protein